MAERVRQDARRMAAGAWLAAVAVLAGVTGLGGCSGESAPPREAATATAPVAAGREVRLPADEAAPAAAKMQDAAAERPSLAYEHHLTLEVEPAQVAPLHDKALALCRATAAAGCTLLEARVNSGDESGAFLRLRLAPAELPRLVAALGTMGEVTHRSTSVEDLAAPLGDTQKRIELLTRYRSQLEALQARAGADVESAMKIARELAQVQSELEAVSGERAHLDKRVRTEILHLSIQPARHAALRSPIGEALAAFAGNLTQAVAAVITFIAYALPWGALLAALVWAGRRLLRWRRGRAAQGQAPSAQAPQPPQSPQSPQ